MLHQAHAVAPTAIAFLAILDVDGRVDAGNFLDADGGDSRRPHGLDDDLARGHQLHGLVKRGPCRPELTCFLELDQLVAGEVNLLLRHVALVAVLDQARAFEAERRIHDADRGHVENCSLALEFWIDQILPLSHLVTNQIRSVAN